ncbi:hypothetical protein J3B02_004833, partial [Coemansia erecta]
MVLMTFYALTSGHSGNNQYPGKQAVYGRGSFIPVARGMSALVAKGLEITANSRAAVLAGNINVIICFVFDAVFLNTVPSVLGIAGTLVILFSIGSLD